jgi:group II intron reverse transcriptase/maturase
MKRKHHSLIDKVYALRNLEAAWKRVQSNNGCAGIDRVSVESFGKNASTILPKVHELLKDDRYTPKAVKRVWIPKSDGRKRPLGIPTVVDRVVQQAVLNILGPIFERKFLSVSFGFRLGRSTHDAMREVWRLLQSGRTWVVDLDIKSYFDTIPHDRLIDHVAEEVADGRVLGLIRQFLTSKVMEDLKLIEVELGTPQGGVISPLLANIYLHHLDAKMVAEGYEIVRYADDLVVICRTRAEAQAALARLKSILEGELELTVHPEKTRIVHVSQGFEFLGYRIYKAHRCLYARPREKSVRSFCERIRTGTRRCQGVNLAEMIRRLSPVIRGWGNYFHKAHVRTLFFKMDRWITWRVYAFIAGRWRNQAWKRYPRTVLRSKLGLVSLYSLCPDRRARSGNNRGEPDAGKPPVRFEGGTVES